MIENNTDILTKHISQKTCPVVVVHDGEFHADEVIGVSLIRLIFGKIHLIRTRDTEIINKGDFVLDVGGIFNPKIKRFDHHQIEYKEDMASGGMILDWLQNEGWLDIKFANYLKNFLIKGVDLQDIGKYHPRRGICTFSDIIALFNPPDPIASDKEYLTKFNYAVDFTLDIFEKIKIRYIQNHKYKKRFMYYVNNSHTMPKGILILDENLPWKEFIYSDSKCNELYFVIFPLSKHKWILHTIPKSPFERYSDRLKLPKSWAGLLEGDMIAKTKIDDSIFCHKQRFIAGFKSKEGALKAAEIALKKLNKKS